MLNMSTDKRSRKLYPAKSAYQEVRYTQNEEDYFRYFHRHGFAIVRVSESNCHSNSNQRSNGSFRPALCYTRCNDFR